MANGSSGKGKGTSPKAGKGSPSAAKARAGKILKKLISIGGGSDAPF